MMQIVLEKSESVLVEDPVAELVAELVEARVSTNSDSGSSTSLDHRKKQKRKLIRSKIILKS